LTPRDRRPRPHPQPPSQQARTDPPAGPRHRPRRGGPRMSAPSRHQLPLLLDDPYWCYDCAVSSGCADLDCGAKSHHLSSLSEECSLLRGSAFPRRSSSSAHAPCRLIRSRPHIRPLLAVAHQADRQQNDPTAAANDANPFNESYWTPLPQFEGEDEGDI